MKLMNKSELRHLRGLLLSKYISKAVEGMNTRKRNGLLIL